MVKHPRRGSLAYLPRKRARRPVGRIRSWPEVNEGPRLLAFAGYKAGMTYVCILDDNPNSPTYGREIVHAATVIDAPPMIVCGIRLYEKAPEGLRTLTEIWAENLPKDLGRLLTLPKESRLEERFEEARKLLSRVEHVHLILCTQPRLAGFKKKPELMEVRVGGGSIEERFDFAKQLLGKEVRVSDVLKEGQYVDVIAITRGKGLAGPVKRWGIKLLTHKARKGRRKPGSLGARGVAHVLWTVPRAGQLGYHQRTEYNKLILKIGSDGREITPGGGFKHYGIVRGDYLLIDGSVPGVPKRLVKLRLPIRAPKALEKGPQITYIHVPGR